MTYARELYEAGKVNFRVLVERGQGKSETSFFISWGVPSGQVALGSGREDSHRQREEEGECSGSTLDMYVVKTSGFRGACAGSQENHLSLECHCGFGTPDGIERAEAGD